MSDDQKQAQLEARVARLERIVSELRARSVESMHGEPPPRAPGGPPDGPAATPPPRFEPPAGGWQGRDALPDLGGGFRVDTEKLLGRVGIGFVVLAFAFLLKLSFDRGWITPALRLGAGGAAGAVLLGLGLRLESTRRTLAQALLAGAIGLFYLVTWAGMELYGFFPLVLALSLMSTTTLLAFVLAERQESEALGVMAIGGGLATPWVLPVGAVSEAGPAGYMTLILLGGAALFLLRGWPVLLLTTLLLGWLASAAHVFQVSDPGLVTLGLVGTYWATTVGAAVTRPLFTAGRGPPLSIHLVRMAVAWGSAAAVLMLALALESSRTGTGFLVLGLAGLFAVLALLVRGIPASFVPAVEGVAVSVAVGLTLLTWGPLTPLVLILECAVLLEICRRGGPASLGPVAHALALTSALTLVGQSLWGLGEPFTVLHYGALPHLGVLALAVVAGERAGRHAAWYRGGAYLGLLVWFFAEFSPRTNGEALVSIAWAAQGAAALVVSRITRSQAVQVTGLGTVALVAAKLLLVDLAQLDPVWRILLFLGFGATLLGLGYWLNVPEREDEGEESP